MLEMNSRCQKSKSSCQSSSCRSSEVDTQCKSTNIIQDALGQFPDETLLSTLDKLLYGVGVGNFISSNSCPPKDCLPACCAPSPSDCVDNCDDDAVIAVKSCKGSTTSVISLKSCQSRGSAGSTASRMRYTTPCGKYEEHFILDRDTTGMQNPCPRKRGGLDRIVTWAKGLPCSSSKKPSCNRSKPVCCKRINCQASSCADAKVNVYDDGSKTVEIVERRPPHCLKKPRTILFIGILKDGTAVSFDVPDNC